MITNRFNKLGKAQQLALINRFGVLLLESTRCKYFVRLYNLFNFYVEAYCLIESGEVVIINAFDDTNYLQPYLQEIDISGIA
jgi:hypothetical protein